MKLKNKDILNFVNGCASLREKRLPVKLGYAIKKNLAAVSDAANAYDAERQELLEKYAAKGEDGKFLVENGQYSRRKRLPLCRHYCWGRRKNWMRR